MRGFKNLFVKLGAKDKPYPMMYGDIFRKMAIKVFPNRNT
jgi:hypothetical protein